MIQIIQQNLHFISVSSLRNNSDAEFATDSNVLKIGLVSNQQ